MADAAFLDCSLPWPWTERGCGLFGFRARWHGLDAAVPDESAGVTVKIFTARACDPASIPMVATWLAAHGLGSLPITNHKDYDMAVAFDDRAIQIVFGTGMSVMEMLVAQNDADAAACSSAAQERH